MYITDMNLKAVAGVRVKYCQARERQRHYYPVQDTIAASTILLVGRGGVRFNFNGHPVVAQKDDLVSWDPGELQDFLHAQGRPVSFQTMVFDVIALDGRKLKLRDIGFPRRLRPGKPASARGLLSRIRNVFHTRDPLRLFRCSQLGLEFLDRLDRDTQPLQPAPKDPEAVLHHRVRDALEYIYFNFKKRLEVAELARMTSTSADHFTRLFRRQVGVSPARYILEFKIRKAMDFLGTYDEPLAFTGEELGFHDYSHFSRTFKRITGMSPRQFVKKGKKGYDPKQDEWNL